MLSGFTISGGNANGDDWTEVGGIGFQNGSGGGICNFDANSEYRDLIITGNAAKRGGGVANFLDQTQPKFTNLIIKGNSASDLGGGVYNGGYSEPILRNVLIAGNTADNKGGGMASRGEATPQLFNVTLTGNTAPQSGAIMTDASATTLITNSIVYGNGLNGTNGRYVARNSLIEGEDISYDGNVPGAVNPLFQDPINGDYRLMACSPAINAGENAMVDQSITTDLDGNIRIQLATVDLGALESSGNIPDESASLTVTGYSVTVDQNGMGKTVYIDNCSHLVAKITGDGSPNSLSGSTTVKVWVDNNQPANYVKRYYEIIPDQNRSEAQGTVTIYFTNAEFQAYNLQSPAPAKLLPDAADDYSVEERILNLLIEKRSGDGGETGQPENYTGTSTNITPSSVIWNEVFSRWEVTFGVSGFSGFFVKTEDRPLPVRLVSFKAAATEGQTQLDWRIADAEGFSHFEVERSYDGVHFTSIAQVDYRPELSLYGFTDKLAGNITYYRLRMIDLNGAYAYSPLKMIRNEEGKLLAYPNPFGSRLTLFSKHPQKVTISDISGRIVGSLQLITGENSWNSANLTSGLYLIKTEDGTVIKMVRQ